MEPVDPCLPPASIPPGSKAVVVAESQQDVGYTPLPSVITPDQKVVTRWQLSPDERRALIEGRDLYLTVCTFGQHFQPVLLTIGPPDRSFLEAQVGVKQDT